MLNFTSLAEQKHHYRQYSACIRGNILKEDKPFRICVE